MPPSCCSGVKNGRKAQNLNGEDAIEAIKIRRVYLTSK